MTKIEMENCDRKILARDRIFFKLIRNWLSDYSFILKECSADPEDQFRSMVIEDFLLRTRDPNDKEISLEDI